MTKRRPATRLTPLWILIMYSVVSAILCTQITVEWFVQAQSINLITTMTPTTTDIDVQSAEMTAKQEEHYDNSIDTYKQVGCGAIVTNLTTVLVKNPNHPQPTYTKAICEAVIERASPSINMLKVKFRQLELYRPTHDGRCLHDRFALYTDLNVPVSPIICGNHTGRTIAVPFESYQTSLILSITTSDLDHDRSWVVQVVQEK